MITIKISGPKKDDPKSVAMRLSQQFAIAGKVVRRYDAATLPDTIPQDAAVVIITEEHDNV